MAFTVIQAGATLQLANDTGVLTTLTLPTGITLKTDRPPRFDVAGRVVIMANTPSRPITIDSLGVVRVLCPRPPSQPLTLSGPAVGGLSGDYKAVQTFITLDASGNIISESDYGPVMSSAFTAAGKTLAIAGLNISPDAITGSNIYRTTSGGSVYFKWRLLDGNVQTSSDNDAMSDAALSLVAAPPLGSPPDLTLVKEWRGRVWGVDRVDIDYLRFSELSAIHAWPPLNTLLIPREGSDVRGIVALLPRRDALGVGRRNILYQISGTSPVDFRVVKLSENIGIESQETVCIFRDTVYWLWKDGVYQWGSDGIKCISDGEGGKGMVRTWFATDTYFNRARFPNAFAHIDPIRKRYRLFLATPGSSIENRWVEFDIMARTWWGPHKTDAFTTLTSAFTAQDANDVMLPLTGVSTGFLLQAQDIRTDSASTAIDFSVDSKFHDGGNLNMKKLWNRLSMLGKVQTSGTIIITPKLGYYDVPIGTPLTYTMSKGRQILGRLGIGQLLQLNFRQTAAGIPVELYGYEIPYTDLGEHF